ncbi:MAG: hypothetical protein B0W54_12875 [Cellvibrio sp. 79]|nr:MAG: hypothetical protein B0W54_12875 [Cellvibrio sp. 79]
MQTSLIADTPHFQIVLVEIYKGRRCRKSYFELIQKPGNLLSTYEFYQAAVAQLRIFEKTFGLPISQLAF